MKTSLKLISAAILTSIAASATANQDLEDIEVITVSGDFKQESIQSLSASVHVMGAEDIAMRNAVHLEQMLNSAANVNFTAGASRGRYIQIRGIGLRSQFVDPINPSVGLIIDGINYSGLGGGAILFDTQQAEIYRGPQGTRFGADAMAGMIHIDTADASIGEQGKFHLGVGNLNSTEFGVAGGAGLEGIAGFRVSAYQSTSDGYMHNAYLDEATQDQNEFVARFKAKSDFSEEFVSEFNLHYIDIDNGYDGFTLDNSRTSVADEPGRDKQESYAFSLHNNFSGLELFDINLNITALDADLEYGFDYDWTCNNPSEPELCEAGLHPSGYSMIANYIRDRQDHSLELNFQGKERDWIGGIYYQSKDVDLTHIQTWQTPDFTSTYEVDNFAAFGQFETQFGDKTTLISGLRVERYQGDYIDNNGVDQTVEDTMFGGKLALEHQVNDQAMIYSSLTRGYKAGGVNGQTLAEMKKDGSDKEFFDSLVEFEPEYLWSGEFGVKGVSKDQRLVLRLAAFYMYRDNMQVRAYKTYPASNGDTDAPDFVSYTGNAASGRNYGLEIDGNYQLTEKITINGAVGYLQTRIDDFVNGDGESKDGRDQAQSPRYTYAFSARYDATDNLYVNLGIEGKDEYFYSDSHDNKSESFNLVNAKIAYAQDDWEVSVWTRNLFDKDYTTRGFGFGNDPRDNWTPKEYVQYAEPRVAGVTFTYQY